MAFNNNYNGSSYGGGNNRRDEDKSYTPTAVKICSFYNSDGKTLIPDLFDKKAQEIAESLLGKNKRGFAIGISSSQLRKIFDEVKRFEQILFANSEQWNKQLPYIKMVKSKVAYSVARASKEREKAGLYKNLEIFISSSIDLIKTEQDYHVFVSLFEAAYGFYYGKAVAAGLKD